MPYLLYDSLSVNDSGPIFCRPRFRNYGDINGDRHVDVTEFALFLSTFNPSTGQTGFLVAFDFNDDGHIDMADFGQFSLRFFTVLP